MQIRRLSVVTSPQASLKEAAALSRGALLIRDGRLAEARRELLGAIDGGSSGIAKCSNAALLEAIYFASREAASMSLAAEAAVKWAALMPDSARAHGVAGEALVAKGDDRGAEPFLRRATEIDPSQSEPWTSLGHVMARLGRPEDALEAFAEARRRAPDRAAALLGALSVHLELGELDALDALLREALPRFEWEERVLALAAVRLNFRDGISAVAHLAAHRRYGAAVAANASALTGATATTKPAGVAIMAPHSPRGPRRSLRVGLFSPDFRRHAVASFLLPFVRHARESGLEIVGFHQAPVRDDITERFAAHMPLHEVSAIDDEALFRLARRQNLDVAIDLAGLSHGHRHRPFAARMAPLQATWLGYPSTTGVPGIDVRIVDGQTDPPGSEAFHSERLLRLERPFLAWESLVGLPAIDVPFQLEHRARPFTFGSFNALAKISPRCIELWSGALKAVPESRLMLKAAGLTRARVVERLKSALASQGVEPSRLDVIPWQPTLEDHLRSYLQVDLALDTVPYNGTTTTVEALAMGTPVAVFEGDRHVSRVGAMIARAVGCEAFVASTPEDLSRIALDWSRRTAEDSATWREALRARLFESPICNGAALAEGVASALRAAIPIHQRR